MTDYIGYTPADLIDLIDEKFEAYVGMIDRTDVKWGMWSREMNLVIREKMESVEGDKVIYGLVLGYWVIVSQLLDLIYNYELVGWLKRFQLEKKIKDKTQEAISVREAVYEDS